VHALKSIKSMMSKHKSICVLHDFQVPKVHKLPNRGFDGERNSEPTFSCLGPFKIGSTKKSFPVGALEFSFDVAYI
jgi:hypothetical protein